MGEDRGYDVDLHIKVVQELGVILHADREGVCLDEDSGWDAQAETDWTKKISGQFRFVAAIYNLVRIGSLNGRWSGSHT